MPHEPANLSFDLKTLLLGVALVAICMALTFQGMGHGLLGSLAINCVVLLILMPEYPLVVRLITVLTTAVGAGLLMYWCAKGWVLGLNSSQFFGLWPSGMGAWGAGYLAGGLMIYLCFVRRPPHG